MAMTMGGDASEWQREGPEHEGGVLWDRHDVCMRQRAWGGFTSSVRPSLVLKKRTVADKPVDLIRRRRDILECESSNIVCMIVTSNAIVREQRRLDITPASPDRKKSLALMDGTVPAMAVLRTVCGTALCCVGGDGACVKYYPFT